MTFQIRPSLRMKCISAALIGAGIFSPPPARARGTDLDGLYPIPDHTTEGRTCYPESDMNLSKEGSYCLQRDSSNAEVVFRLFRRNETGVDTCLLDFHWSNKGALNLTDAFKEKAEDNGKRVGINAKAVELLYDLFETAYIGNSLTVDARSKINSIFNETRDCGWPALIGSNKAGAASARPA